MGRLVLLQRDSYDRALTSLSAMVSSEMKPSSAGEGAKRLGSTITTTSLRRLRANRMFIGFTTKKNTTAARMTNEIPALSKAH
jgi:hypothetical protein